ncbi:TetR/AcrR family transcriptional regulator [Mycobacterium avium]|uniref:TetR/AcrR family transcriptional regulator n=1 Tax=Mycobacterium avium subsp. hominissuis TaxID=439334 RepID=A0A3B6XCL5_MYCAV|nr:TetR/AcrR family transcriptional regulator [Mycobacterium avium]ETA99319.1 TetR family transcriptional regulator [Mycobacterium avium 10-5581]APA74961.1 TetR/AcrR family transcriptional regulator [Mycobacterium avium subsp. hominissuis]ATO61964.1 TetR/AcrR family transcriptional regulator [Mycobacterium avium subsp. hominissuis]ATO66501.1 TetR/AcrR family transcriptional regulator [Mycobacterium avium subsp. hominissuis]ATO71032.2 TetR/AcrR family transcriptional regulator [Mycobacterium av
MSTNVSPATDTRELIVAAAFTCFGRQGLQKATIVDIAKQAGVSRSTIYEYFSDKAAIVEACAEHASERFYREMAKAMNRGGTLEERLCAAAVFVTQARRVIASEKYFDEDAISLLLTKDAAVLLRECVEFFAPYLAAARLTGEVRKDLDVEAAGEWFARILFSLFSTPSPTLNLDDADVTAEFVRAHVVRGFAGERPRRR